jgi:hypothetical protein
MARALLIPEVKRGGKREKGKSEVSDLTHNEQSLISQARAVLRIDERLAAKVMGVTTASAAARASPA